MMPERKRVLPTPPPTSAVEAAQANAATAAMAVDTLQSAPAGDCHVFVYGTLQAGGSNDITRYRPSPRWIGPAGVAGTLYDFGGWPGLLLAGDQWVVGEIWRIDARIEQLLDQLEGVRDDGQGDYLKRRLLLMVDGQLVECLVYEINADRLPGRSIVPSGDWMAHCASHAAPPAAHDG